MTKGIGWDIGIKNLAYCVLDSGVSSESPNAFKFNNSYYDISHWSDISLVSQIESNLQTSGQVSHINNNNNLKCCFVKDNVKKGSAKSDNASEESKVCGKTAFYVKDEVLEGNEGDEKSKYSGLCKTHYKKLQKQDASTQHTPPSTPPLSTPPRLPEVSVKKCWTEGCNSKTVQVLKSHIYKGFCKKHINEMQKAKTHSESDFLKINHAKSTAKIDINQLGIALFQELNKITAQIVEPCIILLENQPVLKNPTMKSMQMFLYSYYLMKIMEGNNISNKKLQCYCASKKLDLIKFLTEEEQTKITTFIETVNNPYQKNKKMSIMIVEVLLQNNTKWLEFFKSHPKQDDLADSLLMTLHYFSRVTRASAPRAPLSRLTRASATKVSATRAPLDEEAALIIDEEAIIAPLKQKKSSIERASEKKAKGKAGLKPSKIPIVDAEGTSVLDEVKSKKRNRIIKNLKHKNDSDDDE